MLSALSPVSLAATRDVAEDASVGAVGVGANESVMRAEGAALSFAEFSVKCRIASRGVLGHIGTCGCNRSHQDTNHTGDQDARR